jgi:hypothetical protein
MSLTAPTVKVKPHRQTQAEREACYDYVTARDGTCRVWEIALFGLLSGEIIGNCGGRLGEPGGRTERHHAFTGIGHKRITDARHVVLLCEFHHRTWAPTHTRLILDWLARIEDEREMG